MAGGLLWGWTPVFYISSLSWTKERRYEKHVGDGAPSRKKRQRSLTRWHFRELHCNTFQCVYTRFIDLVSCVITVMYLLVIYVYHISIVKLISNNYIGIKVEFSLRVVYTSYTREELEKIGNETFSREIIFCGFPYKRKLKYERYKNGL